MNSKVEPIKECQICFELYTMKNISKIKCWAENEDDHIICKFCFEKESNNRKNKGIKSPNECILCKPYQEKIEQITINPSRNITIIIENNISSESSLTYLVRIIAVIFIMILMYIGLNLNWHFFRMFGYFLDTGDFLDESIEWSLTNAFYALLLDSFIFIMIISIANRH